MKLPFLLALLAACASAQPTDVHICPPPPQAPFQILGEARTALSDSYDLMTLDPEAQQRVGLLDYIFIANADFLVEHSVRYRELAACTTHAIEQVLPDMAVFATQENTIRLKRAHDMFAAMGGTCVVSPTSPGSKEEASDADGGSP